MIKKLNYILLIFLLLNATSINILCLAESRTATTETNCQKAWVGISLIGACVILAVLTSTFPPPPHHSSLVTSYLATTYNSRLKEMREQHSDNPQASLTLNNEHANRFSSTHPITCPALPGRQTFKIPKERSSKRSAFNNNNKASLHPSQRNIRKKK